jgi:hypothetical protein
MEIQVHLPMERVLEVLLLEHLTIKVAMELLHQLEELVQVQPLAEELLEREQGQDLAV